VATDELWGRGAVALGERVAGAASPEEALARLQRHIVGRLGDAPGPDPLVSEAVRQLMPWRLMPWRTADVGSLTSSLYISERQLRRRCQAAVGLAPKALHRMLRFQGFLALAHGRGGHPAELARLAAEAGYADQSHLTRECLRLSALSPAALLRESLENCRAAGHDHAVSYAPLLDGLH
jgi:AraC-like DNA-binding protein